MPYQTTVQRADAVRYGSMKIEVGDTVGTLIDLGALKDVVKNEQWTLVKTIGGNVGEIKRRIKDHIVTFTFNWQEYDLEAANTIRGGIDTYTPVAASPVTVTGEAHGTGWTQGKPIKLTYKNGANTVVTSITVKGGGSSLVANTDYRTYVGDGSNGSLGYTYIVPITAQAGAITVDYTYTPNASKKLTTGGKIEIGYKVMRLTNTNEDGKTYQVTVYKAANANGININFPNDDDDAAWETPVTIEGVCDATRTAGDQLMEIIDEQSVA
jgi:hypothetical protein